MPIANDNDLKTWHDNHYRLTSPETAPRAWNAFEDLADPNNPGNRLSGWVQRAGGDEYGCLVIARVNGLPAPQRIMATPKTSYPYRRDRAWLMRRAQRVASFLKYDGTNICQYSYHDAHGGEFTSFKLRLRPFIPPRFQSLLERTLEQYPGVRDLKLAQGEAMVYELYGRNNPMLIRYTEDIELRSLFRRNPEDDDIQPARADDPNFSRLDCPLAEETAPGDWRNSREEYLRRQAEHSGNLIPVTAEGETAFQGNEGEMLYVRFSGRERSKPGDFTRMIKLKPTEIEEIHQAGDFVPKAELEATVRNIFEAADNPDITDFLMMLSEEWSDRQVGRSMETAERVLAAALRNRAFQDAVLEKFLAEFQPEQFQSETRTVMRRLSEHFPKGEMKRVYSTLAERLPGG